MAITQSHHDAVERAHAAPMSAVDWIAMTLLIVGGLNWGLVGVFGFNLVAAIFGDMSALSRIVYALVGLSALWCIYAVVHLHGDQARTELKGRKLLWEQAKPRRLHKKLSLGQKAKARNF